MNTSAEYGKDAVQFKQRYGLKRILFQAFAASGSAGTAIRAHKFEIAGNVSGGY